MRKLFSGDPEESMANELHVIFDGPPGPEAGRFVEVEDGYGNSVNAGEWQERPDGLWALCIAGRDATIAEIRDWLKDAINGPEGCDILEQFDQIFGGCHG